MRNLENQPSIKTQREITDEYWNTKGLEYWRYKEGAERAHFPDAFEQFYILHRSEFRDVLDIGCGTGRFLIPMAEDGLNVTGLEPSDGMRHGAELNVEAASDILKGEVKLVKGESKKLDFPDASFDYVIAKGSIHHNTWEDVKRSFQEAARVLKPGQFFLFQGRSPNDSAFFRSEQVPGEAGFTATETSGKKDIIQHYFTEKEIKKLGVENGFTIEVEPEEIIKKREDGGQNARWWVVYRKI